MSTLPQAPLCVALQQYGFSAMLPGMDNVRENAPLGRIRQNQFLPVGTVISRAIELSRMPFDLFRHYGIVVGYDGGEILVRSLQGNGQILNERLSAFSRGWPVKSEGYWGNLSPMEVVNRSQHYHSADYNLLASNCEHFVRYAHGLEVRSVQVNSVLAGIVIVGGVFLLSAKRGKLPV